MSRRGETLQQVLRSLCVGIAALACVVLFGRTHASQPLLDETIVIRAHSGFTQIEKTPLRDEMLKLAKTSPTVSPENIENLAVAYLAPRLKANAPATTNPSVISNTSLNHRGLPGDDPTILRINFTPWVQNIDGQRVIIGSLAVHPWHYTKQSSGICILTDESEFEPVDTFIITDDNAQTQRNLKSTIARLLERYTRGIRQKF